MGTDTSRGNQGILRQTKEALAIVISIISFIISTVNVYVTNLKAPDLSMVVAPYIRHIVDNQSLNETFFVPLTVVNQGAKPGSLLSFEMDVTYLQTGEHETYYAQYFAQRENSELLGSFFMPLNLAGYSTEGRTVCFYPLGEGGENFFAQQGTYEFTVTGVAANVKGRAQKKIVQVFRIDITEEIYAQMQRVPDREYPYPMRIEATDGRRSLLDILSGIGR